MAVMIASRLSWLADGERVWALLLLEFGHIVVADSMRRPSETMSLCNDFARGVADSRNTFPRPDLVGSVRIGLGEIAPTSCLKLS